MNQQTILRGGHRNGECVDVIPEDYIRTGREQPAPNEWVEFEDRRQVARPRGD